MNTWRGFHPVQDVALLMALEKEYQIQFPAEYKETAQRYNRGVPRQKLILCDGCERVFERLISISIDDYPNVVDARKWLDQENDKVFPFGLDPFGNIFALSFKSRTEYSLIYINMENGIESYVADSFDAFLNGLYM